MYGFLISIFQRFVPNNEQAIFDLGKANLFGNYLFKIFTSHIDSFLVFDKKT